MIRPLMTPLCAATMLFSGGAAKAQLFGPPAAVPEAIAVPTPPVVVERPVMVDPPVVLDRPVVSDAPVVVERPVVSEAPVVVERPASVAPALPGEVPTTVWRPVMPDVSTAVPVVPYAPGARPVVVRQKTYVPGQPVRNTIKAITP